MSKQEEMSADQAAEAGGKGKGSDKPVQSKSPTTFRRSAERKGPAVWPLNAGTERPRPNASLAPDYVLGGLRWPD